ncbi:MAG: hypothetical protein ACR2LC_16965 [Pyrinomonadaceae bacterium]
MATGTINRSGGYKISVADPNNPSQLIQVDATPDANGNLVPIDSRYSPTLGFNNQPPSSTTSQETLLVFGGIVLLGVLLISRG